MHFHGFVVTLMHGNEQDYALILFDGICYITSPVVEWPSKIRELS